MITSNFRKAWNKNSKKKPKEKKSWNKYRSQITIQPKNSNLDYIIDRTFKAINRLFIQLFKAVETNPTRNSFVMYYKPLRNKLF